MVVPKSNLDTHVSLPNDGVLLHCYIQTTTSTYNKSGTMETGRSGIKEAMELLQHHVEERSLESNTLKEFAKGQTTGTMREQLSTLRAYRSTLLNLSKNKNWIPQSQQKNNNNIIEDDDDDESPTQSSNSLKSQIGIYRILLELGLSYMTPYPMKRASESCLSALETILTSKGGTGTICHDIHESVVDSILGDCCLWSHRLYTLFDMLSFLPTLSVVLDKKRYIHATLEKLMEEGCDLEHILPMYKQSRENNNIIDDSRTTKGGGRENINVDESVISSHVLDAIEKGVQICTTLKILLKEEERLLSHLTTNDNDDGDGDGVTYAKILNDILMELLVRVTIPLIRCKATSSDALNACAVTLGQLLSMIWKLNIGTTREGGKISQEVQTLVNCITHRADADVVESTGLDSWASTTNVVDWKSLLRCLPSLNQVAIVKGLAATLGDDILSSTVVVDGGKKTMLLMDPIGTFILHVASVSTENGARLLALKGLETVIGRWRTILNKTKDRDGYNIMLEQATTLAREVLEVALVTWESPPSRQIDSAIPGLFQNLVSLMEILDRNDAVGVNSMDDLVCNILQQPSTRKGKYVALEALLPKIGASKLIRLSKSMENDAFASSYSSSFVSSFLLEIGRRGNSSAAVAELLAKVFSMLRVELHSDAGIDICRIEQGNRKERRKRESERMNSTPSKTSDMSREKLEKESILLLESWYSLWAPPLAAALIGSEVSSRTQIASFCLPLLTTFVGGKGNRVNASHAFAILLDEITSQGIKDGKENHEALLWAKFEVVKHAHLLNLIKISYTSKMLASSIARALPLNLVCYSMFHEVPRLRLLALQSLPSLLFTYDNQQLSTTYYLKREIDIWKIALPYAVKCSEKEYIVTITQILNSLIHRISETVADVQSENCSLLLNFVNNFLLSDLFVQKVAYPGTVADNEKWALSMIESIFQKQKNITEQFDYKRHIIANIVSDDVIATLISLVNSMWDNTRSTAYTTVLDILEHAKGNSINLPNFMTNDQSRELFKARAIHLASSPRQREADTGARMISILCATISNELEQYNFLDYISGLCEKRLSMMESSLGLLQDKSKDSNQLFRNELPLAHGLIQALRLMVERWDFKEIPDSITLYRSMIKNCFRAIEISLIVVADIKDNSDELRSNELKLSIARAKQAKNIPINVNTGAIGANATFASLKTVNEDEKKSRLLKQRIVMGTWLLIKEACATLSTFISSSPRQDIDLISAAGDLLITTLTSLKHQGAAFAAHKALQQLCILCYSTTSFDIMQLPSIWADKFLYEISSAEIVRDSTLRRSTGYGLGFLSILRSEQVSPKFLFPKVISYIIKLSLPAESVMKRQTSASSLSSDDMFIYHRKYPSITGLFVPDEGYEERTRIHALNILRLIILDAPLAGDTREFIGDCIISSLIGYKDSLWTIRNSSTMCFAAIMLRVVDADKNADTTLVGSNERRTRHAATAKELFRSYPSLAVVLLALIEEENATSGYQQVLHPTLFPLLLMLARLQPLCSQKVQPDNDGTLDRFVDPIIKCLGHVHHKVRLVASRALAILCSSDSEIRDGSSRGAIIDKCIKRLSYFAKTKQISHNLDHGILLALKFLLRFAPQPQKYLQGHVYEAVIYYATWSRFTLASHPLCTAVALEIWFIASFQAQQPSYIACHKQPHMTLPVVCVKLINIISMLSTKSSEGDVSGFAYLARVASEITCKNAFHHIFAPECSSEERAKYVGIAENCFTDPNHDVMLHSVKAFKKGLYDALEKLNHEKNHTSLRNVDLLSSVGKLALRSLYTILNRGATACHPPTLRRLSRIALEVLYGIQSMNSQRTKCGSDAPKMSEDARSGDALMTDSPTVLFDSLLRTKMHKQTGNAISITEVSDLSLNQLWDMSMQLLCIGGREAVDQKIQGEYMSGGTVLTGNALELASFVLMELCTAADNEALQLTRHVKVFVQLVEDSTHPLSSWKVRHSAALAILNSGLMRMPHIESSIENSRAKLYIKLLELLQDNDEDVRRAAGRALSNSFAPMVSMLTLQDASLNVPMEMQTLDMFNLILDQLATRSKNLINQMNNLLTEFEYTASNPKLESILNLNTERKIFEEEDPNPYEESLIITQSLVVMITKFPFEYSQHNESLTIHIGDIYSTYESVMRRMIEMFHKTEKCPDIAHNFTLDGNIFPALHGLILSVAVGLLFGVEDERIVNLADDILSMDAIYLHPCIKTALNMVTKVKKFDHDSQQQILQSCFHVQRSK